MSEIENLKIGNGGTLHIVGNEDIIANEWEAGQVYIENRSYVIREHKLLMCNTTHTSVEPFDPDKWTEKNIGEALGTAGSANMIECTLAEYNAWKAGGQLINETVYVITDAPNLNATAQEISYDGSTTTIYDTVNELNTIETVSISTSGAIANIYQSKANKLSKLVVVNLILKLTSATSLYALLCTMSKRPLSDMQIFLYSTPNAVAYECHFGADGSITWWNNNVVASNTAIIGQFVYFTND